VVDVASIINLAVSGVQTAIAGAQATGDAVGVHHASNEAQHRQRVAARLLYGETLFNLFALQAGAKATPPCLVFSDSGFRSVVSAGHLPDIASDPDTLMRVAAPYTAAQVTRHIFGQDWFALAATRFAGKDLNAIEALAAGLREAEATLRPLAWDEAMAQRLLEEPGSRRSGDRFDAGTSPIGQDPSLLGSPGTRTSESQRSSWSGEGPRCRSGLRGRRRRRSCGDARSGPRRGFPIALGFVSGIFVYAASTNLLPRVHMLPLVHGLSATLGGAGVMFLVTRLD
jgi:hypothetical protein